MDLQFGGAGQDRVRPNHARKSVALVLAGVVVALASQAEAQQADAQAQPTQTPAQPAGAQIPDPWMGANRSLFDMTMSVDRAVIAPPIHAYRNHVPTPIQAGISNVIDNLDAPRVFANDVLQGRFRKAGETTIRFVVNSTAGIGGLIDVAAITGLHGHYSDFGQTLGRWGVPTGPYVFIPFYGPSDVRDGLGWVADIFGDPVGVATNGLKTTFGQVRAGVHVWQNRVDIDDQLTSLGRDFTDPYVTLRSGYSQRRAFKVQEAKGVSVADQVNDLPDFDSTTPASSAPPAPSDAAPKP